MARDAASTTRPRPWASDATAGASLGAARSAARQQSSTSVTRLAGIARKRSDSSTLEIAVRSSASREPATASTGIR
ncbi:MAG TPA: hypothetical protein VK607_16195 [Kofleriaceae bacterium]|nr:hypothetical protein [Kofleriaceae bacterium]